MKKNIAIIILSITLMVFSVYHFFTVISLKDRIKVLKYQQDTVLKVERDVSNSNSDYYKKLAGRALSIMDANEISELARLEWQYKMFINGQEFKGQSIKIDGKDLLIDICEIREKYSMIPEDIRLREKLSSFERHIQIESSVKPEITNKDSEFETHIYYKFKNLKSGDAINIIFDDELKDRMGLPASKFTIYIK